MTEAMPFLQKYDITFLRPPTISPRALFSIWRYRPCGFGKRSALREERNPSFSRQKTPPIHPDPYPLLIIRVYAKKPAEHWLRGKGLWDKRYELLRSWQDGFATNQLISCNQSIPPSGQNVKSEARRKKTTFVARIFFSFPERIEERGHAAQNLQRSRKT